MTFVLSEELTIPPNHMKELVEGRNRALCVDCEKEWRVSQEIIVKSGDQERAVIVTHIQRHTSKSGDDICILTVGLRSEPDNQLKPLDEIPFEQLSSKISAYSKLPLTVTSPKGMPLEIIIPTAINFMKFPESEAGENPFEGELVPAIIDVSYISYGLHITVPCIANFSKTRATIREVDKVAPKTPLIERMGLLDQFKTKH